jgi:hypothetical protein
MESKLIWCDKCNKFVYHYVYVHPKYPYKHKACQICNKKSLYSV